MLETQTASNPMKVLDALRGEPHRLSDYAVPLAAMIYLRWVDFQEAEAEAMAAFDGSQYIALLPASLHWRRWCELPPPELLSLFTDSLPKGIERIGKSRDPVAGSLRRILPGVHAISRLTPRALEHLTRWLLSQPFETPSDRRRLLVQFDHLLDQMNGHEIGQFRTPSDINELLVALAAPAQGERLYDPCFGSAGILTTAWDAIQKAGKEEFIRLVENPLCIAGVEINSQAFVIGLARLALAGVSHPQLELGNSLERESAGNPLKDGFDLVICDPPWGMKVEPHGLDHFPIQTNDGTSLFVQHALSQLRPNGRALIVVPQGFLFQQGKTAVLRQWLTEHHRVEAVVSLPAGAFQPYTAVQSSILMIRRNGGPTQSVRMVDGVSFFEPQKGREPAWILSHQIAALRNALVHCAPSQEVWDVPASILAELGYDLSAARRASSALEQALEVVGKDVPILPLKELCRITSGRSVASSELRKEPIGEHPVPYIRTGDLKRGQTMKNTSWLTEYSAANLGPRHRLRAGDVLLSKAGTIGKAGVVRNGAVGGVASGTLFALAPDTSRIDPHFLVAYLMCRDCQEWLRSRSSGSVISGLRKQFVEELPVPVPPLQIQERVAADFRNHQVDALTQLAQLLTQDENDLLAKWIDRSLKSLGEVPVRDDEDASAVIRFRIFGTDFTDVVAWAIPDSDPPPLMSWALNLINTAELFRGSEEVPPGPALLSMLQSGAKDLSFAEGQIEGHSPLESKARELTKASTKRLEKAIESLLNDVRVVLAPQTKSLEAGTKQEVSFLVKNEGPLPLRNFTIDATNWVYGGTTVFLPERCERMMRAELEAPKAAGRHVIKTEWFGKTMDGREVRGAQEIAFEIVAAASSDQEINLGPSPYFHGPPVGPERNDVFFGRDDLIERIKNQILSGNTVLLADC
jgi:type I restriction enzyme M protein